MLNLTPHHRFHVPNGLAILAAVLLLISSAASYDSKSEIHSSSVDTTPSVKIENTDNEPVNDTTKHKRRGLNLGMLLFRRG